MGDGYKITVEGAKDALLKCHGNVLSASLALGVDRTSLYKFIDANPELHEVRKVAREALLDVAEDQLASHIQQGEIRAITFYLKTQGKDRGYTERQEITGKDGGSILARQEAASLKDLSPADLAKLIQEGLAGGKSGS
jgi:hypothetical protein